MACGILAFGSIKLLHATLLKIQRAFDNLPAAAQVDDEDYLSLVAALANRVGPDASIPSARTAFESYASMGGGSASLWLVIEISYTGTCTSASDDPCQALVDELARIVFDNYADVEELNGVRINITNYSSVGPIDFSYTPIEKALTIEEWRRELSIDTNILCQTGYKDC